MNEAQEQRIRAEIERRGLAVTPFGQGFLIRGPGVEMLVSSLAIVSEFDMRPATPTKLRNRDQPTKGKP
jgi:hypothetical protein